MQKKASIALLLVCLCFFGGAAKAQDNTYSALQYLQQWSAFIATDLSLSNTDDQGRLAAGGDVSLNNYEVGTLLNSSDCSRIDLLAGGSLIFMNGAVPNGEIVANSVSITDVSVECPPVTGPSPIDFDTAFSELLQVAQSLAGLTANGDASVSGTTLALTGSASDKNIFSVSGSTLQSVNLITLNIPGGSFGIINIDGSVNTFANLQIQLSATTSYRYLLWNFYETKTLDISGISVSGSILAPAADVSFNDGNIDGSIAAYSCINGTGEIHYYPILPFCPPCAPCDSNITLPVWSIFIENDVNLTATDDRGNFAAGGNVWLTHYEIGADLPDYQPGVADAIIGGNLVFTSGEVVNGNVLVGGTATTTDFGVTGGGQIYTQASIPIDFATSFQDLSSLSASLSQLTPNGQVSSGFGGAVSALGSEIGLNVFQIDASLLSSVTQLNISVPFNSWVVVNVMNNNADQIADLQINLNGINSTNVLYNFYEATTLTITGVSIQGSILAPLATVQFTNGAIDGSVYASNLYGNGEVHHYPWMPYGPNCSPCPPCNQ